MKHCTKEIVTEIIKCRCKCDHPLCHHPHNNHRIGNFKLRWEMFGMCTDDFTTPDFLISLGFPKNFIEPLSKDGIFQDKSHVNYMDFLSAVAELYEIRLPLRIPGKFSEEMSPVDHLLDAIEHAIILEDPTAVVFYPEIVLE